MDFRRNFVGALCDAYTASSSYGRTVFFFFTAQKIALLKRLHKFVTLFYGDGWNFPKQTSGLKIEKKKKKLSENKNETHMIILIKCSHWDWLFVVQQTSRCDANESLLLLIHGDEAFLHTNSLGVFFLFCCWHTLAPHAYPINRFVAFDNIDSMALSNRQRIRAKTIPFSFYFIPYFFVRSHPLIQRPLKLSKYWVFYGESAVHIQWIKTCNGNIKS